MRLVIEREGGFDIIEDHEAITRIDVQNYGVKVTFVDDTGGEWSEVYPVADHAAACRLSAAIAVRCGVLVEPLAEQPGVVTEPVMFDGGEVITPPPNPRWEGAKRSQWVAGEPPKDGRWYVSNYGLYCIRLVRWSNAKGGWEDSTMSLFGGSGPLAHVPTPIPDVPT